MAGESITRLYVDMQPDDPVSKLRIAKNVVESYWENRRLLDSYDNLKEKSIRMVHQDHWDEEIEEQRTVIGLPSMVADKTLSIWKTLDGYARKNRVDVKFVQVGADDFAGADKHNKIHSWIKATKDLHHYQSEAYGMAAVCDEGFLYIYPEHNGMGQIDPGFAVQDAFECYPDANFKDPIEMNDAEFIDLPFWINPKRVKRDFKNHMTKEFADRLEHYSPAQTFNDERPRNTYRNRDGQTIVSSNGLLLGVKRFYKKYETKQYITDAKGNVVQEYTKADKRMITKSMIESMGMDLMEIEAEELWEIVIIPDVSEEDYVYNMPSDFQPVHPNKLGKMRWPIVRCVFTQVAGKAVGAIRGVVKIQEMRNLILSALMHHLQTAANGGMLRERTVFGGDEIQEQKFDNRRNQAGYTGIVADGALEKQRIAPVPKGETAFTDGGMFLESVLLDVMKDISGAEPIMKGQAQSGSPAALFQMQIEQSQNQLLSSTEYFKFFQYTVADILYSFVRQFWDTQRVLMIEGVEGQEPDQLIVNEETVDGILNDPAQGLYTVHKTMVPVTETARRQRLSDSLEVSKGLSEIGLPTFVQDLTQVVESLDSVGPEQKKSMLMKIKQWQANQGILDEAAIAEQQANAQAAQAQASAAQAGPPAPQMDARQ